MIIPIQSEGSRGAVDTYGGELVSFIHDGREFVWQGNPLHWNGRAPVLFPVVCKALGDKIAFDGKEYPMPKHGIARKREFDPVFMSKDHVVMEQRATEESLKMFPFYYVLQTEHTVSENGFRTVYTVKNYDKDKMTFCIGGHPGFNVPLEYEDGWFEDYYLEFENAEGCTVSITKDGYMDDSVPKLPLLKDTGRLDLRYADFEQDALIVEDLPVKSVKLLSSKTGRGFRFVFEGFDALGIWTPIGKKSPFICLEPWKGLPANVNETAEASSKKYAVTLEPNEEYSVGYSVEVI